MEASDSIRYNLMCVSSIIQFAHRLKDFPVKKETVEQMTYIASTMLKMIGNTNEIWRERYISNYFYQHHKIIKMQCFYNFCCYIISDYAHLNSLIFIH